jgi:pyruvate formate lyase activating enzyme
MTSVNHVNSTDTIDIGGILVSTIEYTGKISLVIFTAGCMLRCPYCHNPGIIEGGNQRKISTIYSKINDSLDFIDSVVLTGGEPLFQKDEITKILRYCKNLGLNTKLDTNGYYPEKLEEILYLVDYVAIDVKAPFNKYKEVIGLDIGENVRKSIQVCLKSNVYLECRTTYVPGLLVPEDIKNIAENIECDVYTIQQFNNKTVLDEKLKEIMSPSRKELLDIAKSIKPFQDNIKIKTSEFGDEKIKTLK